MQLKYNSLIRYYSNIVIFNSRKSLKFSNVSILTGFMSTKRFNSNYIYNSRNNNNEFINKKIQINSLTQRRFNSINTSTSGSYIPEDVQNLTIEEYHTLSDETFEQILDELDSFFEENNIMEAEIDEEAGVMEINCSEGTYVINKQPPTKQIWLSSPLSGPKRFDYHNNQWICLRDNEKLSQLLENEMNQIYGGFKWSKLF